MLFPPKKQKVNWALSKMNHNLNGLADYKSKPMNFNESKCKKKCVLKFYFNQSWSIKFLTAKRLILTQDHSINKDHFLQTWMFKFTDVETNHGHERI
jgi:hypothetical protein